MVEVTNERAPRGAVMTIVAQCRYSDLLAWSSCFINDVLSLSLLLISCNAYFSDLPGLQHS